MRKSCSGTSKIAILPQFLRIDPHFVRKGCSRTSPAQVKSQFYLSFCASTLISCERVAPGQVRHKHNRIFSSVFDDRPSFRGKGLLQDKSGTSKIAILPQFLRIDPHFVGKGCSRTSPAQVKSQFYLSFCASTLISCERVAPGQVRHKHNRIFSSVFDDRPSFRGKGLLQDKSGTSKIAILPQFLRIDPHFVGKG